MATRVFLISILALHLTGCTVGWVYTDTVEPYCADMDSTPVSQKSSGSSIKTFNIPRVPGARMIWSSNAIADAAAKEGIQTVQFCDKKRFSILGGLWGKESIVVYGQ
jgi:hypothetical protein